MLASMTYALVLGDLAAIWSVCYVMIDILLELHSTRVSARAARTPSNGDVRGLDAHKGEWFLFLLEF